MLTISLEKCDFTLTPKAVNHFIENWGENQQSCPETGLTIENLWGVVSWLGEKLVFTDSHEDELYFTKEQFEDFTNYDTPSMAI